MVGGRQVAGPYVSEQRARRLAIIGLGVRPCVGVRGFVSTLTALPFLMVRPPPCLPITAAGRC